MERFRGKVAVVTGASAGIGAACVEELVEAGLKVVGLARRKEKLEELSKKLEGKSGKLYAYAADVTKEEDIINAFKWIKNNVGTVHILINSAGVMRLSTLTEGSTAHWKEVLDTNVLGLSIATREAFKDMKENNVAGHIIHINSEAGHRALKKSNMYGASKYAVTSLTEIFRQELNLIGSKIKITSISPGLVDTDIFEASAKGSGIEDISMIRKVFEQAPFLQSKDVADAMMYVLGTPPHVQVHELWLKPVGEQLM